MTLATAVEVLLSRRADHMVTDDEWLAVAKALASETGKYVEYRTPAEIERDVKHAFRSHSHYQSSCVECGKPEGNWRHQ